MKITLINLLQLQRTKPKDFANYLQAKKEKQVRIWSNQHRAYWRAESEGYTLNEKEAGIYTLQAAFEATSHCGPEKGIEFHFYNPQIHQHD